MAMIQWVLHGNGSTEERPTPYADLRDAGEAEPRDGVYLVASTFSGGRVLMLDRHFDRMERSASILGTPVRVPREDVREALRKMKRSGGFDECRFRVSISLSDPSFCLISMESYAGVAEVVRRSGIVCATAPHSARAIPDAKGTEWIHLRTELVHRGIDPDEIDEFLLLDTADHILEGSSSNFFAVVGSDDGACLQTADEGILSGIVRGVVLDLARGIVPVEFEPLPAGALSTISEAFVTSSSRGVIPVRRIDLVDIGEPGPVTRNLAKRYEWWADAHGEPI